MKLPARLLPYDLYERHAVIARLLRGPLAEEANPTILDVGGRAELLSRFTGCPVLSLNIDGSGDVLGSGAALPFPDGAFFAVTSIDTMEHLPPAMRLPALREALRVARRYLLVAAPYGSAAHAEHERRLDALYRAVHGRPHPYLAEHVRHGLPTEDDLDSWSKQPGAARVQRFYAGDFLWQGRQFERALMHHASGRVAARLRGALSQLYGMALFHPVRLTAAPSPRTNRFYLLIEKRPTSPS